MTVDFTTDEARELRVELENALELYTAHHASVCAWPDGTPNKWELVQHYSNRMAWVGRLLDRVTGRYSHV